MKRLITTQCEQEINVLNIEKEHFERQCSQFSEDIQLCTQQVQELEVQMKVLSQESAISVAGRINVAFARKKRRLDSEIERLLEIIDVKKQQMSEVETQMLHVAHTREGKEQEMIDFERQLVSIVIEQQRYVAQELQQMSAWYEKTTGMMSRIRLFPYPPPSAAASTSSSSSSTLVSKEQEEISLEEVKQMVAQHKLLLQSQLLPHQQPSVVMSNTTYR